MRVTGGQSIKENPLLMPMNHSVSGILPKKDVVGSTPVEFSIRDIQSPQ